MQYTVAKEVFDVFGTPVEFWVIRKDGFFVGRHLTLDGALAKIGV